MSPEHATVSVSIQEFFVDDHSISSNKNWAKSWASFSRNRLQSHPAHATSAKRGSGGRLFSRYSFQPCRNLTRQCCPLILEKRFENPSFLKQVSTLLIATSAGAYFVVARPLLAAPGHPKVICASRRSDGLNAILSPYDFKCSGVPQDQVPPDPRLQSGFKKGGQFRSECQQYQIPVNLCCVAIAIRLHS
jgi:hypothetical protein